LKLPTESLKMVPEFFTFFEGGRVEGWGYSICNNLYG